MTISLSTQLIRALSLTTLAMIAFAGNSVLCRMALQDGAIDAATFTTVRLVAGALMLAIILVGRQICSHRKFGIRAVSGIM